MKQFRFRLLRIDIGLSLELAIGADCHLLDILSAALSALTLGSLWRTCGCDKGQPTRRTSAPGQMTPLSLEIETQEMGRGDIRHINSM